MKLKQRALNCIKKLEQDLSTSLAELSLLIRSNPKYFISGVSSMLPDNVHDDQ